MKFNSISDLLQFAISKEIASNQFYTDIAANIDDKSIRDIFVTLAKEELKHKQELELELMKIGNVVPKKVFNSRHADDDYLLESDLNESLTFNDAIALAIQKERAAFGLYMDIYALTDDDEQKDVIMMLAEEEVRHKIILENHMANTNKG